MALKIDKFNHLLNRTRNQTGVGHTGGFGQPAVRIYMTHPTLGFQFFNTVYPLNGPLPHDAVEGYQKLRRSDVLRSLDALHALGNAFQPAQAPTKIKLSDVLEIEFGGINRFQFVHEEQVSTLEAYNTPGKPGWSVVDNPELDFISDIITEYAGTVTSHYENGAEISASINDQSVEFQQEYTSPGPERITVGETEFDKIDVTVDWGTGTDEWRRVFEFFGHRHFGPGLGGFNYVIAAQNANPEVQQGVTDGVLQNGAVTAVTPSTFDGPTGLIHRRIEHSAVALFDGFAGAIFGGTTLPFAGGDGGGPHGAFAIGDAFGGPFDIEEIDFELPDPVGAPIVTVEYDGAFVWALDSAAFASLAATYPTFRRLSNDYSGL